MDQTAEIVGAVVGFKTVAAAAVIVLFPEKLLEERGART
jgi:hypothetical protein